MDDHHARDRIRSFNRTVTQRVGVLEDEYLARGRPLGASRVLWEIGEGTDTRRLRERLDLDSGYLSRVLGGLAEEGLVELAPDHDDRRVRRIRPTAAGVAERAVLDERSDALATSFLDPLNARQRERLVDAMATVERLLTAGLVRLEAETPTTADARYCLQSYYEELDRRFDQGFDVTAARQITPDDMTPPAGLLVVARLRTDPVGCGALTFHGDGPAEIKRVWVDTSIRGLGLGRRIMAELEDRAWQGGASAVRLDTNRNLAEAIALYQALGYREVPAFNDEPYAHHWFQKDRPRGRTTGSAASR